MCRRSEAKAIPEERGEGHYGLLPPQAVVPQHVKVAHAEDAPEVVTILGEFHLVVGLAGGLVPVDIGLSLHK